MSDCIYKFYYIWSLVKYLTKMKFLFVDLGKTRQMGSDKISIVN